MARDIKLGAFKFLKVFAERAEDFKGELKIIPNINIKSIDKHKSEPSKQESLKVDFKFEVDYNDLGKISLEGNMYLLVDAKTMKEAISGWKDKKLDEEIQTIILNLIMHKSSLRALELEDELNLPLHVQIPRLQIQPRK